MRCFILFISLIFPAVLCESEKLKEDEKVTIDTLEDVEVLTYFLLWKYNYFQQQQQVLENEEMLSLVNKNMIRETELRTFLENLKHDKLVQEYANLSSSFSKANSINCRNIDHHHAPFQQAGVSQEKVRKLCEAANRCKSPSQLTQLVSTQIAGSKPQTISQAVVRLCPLMLFQLHDDKCLEEQQENFKLRTRPSSGSVWGFAVLFVTIISFCSLVGVAIMPFLTKSSYDAIITLFEGLAVGSLVGSAIFHLIPQAFGLVGEDPTHSYLWKALILFGGIYLFFCSERIMKIVVELRRKKKLREQPLPSCTSDELEKPRLINYKERKVCFLDSELNTLNEMENRILKYSKDERIKMGDSNHPNGSFSSESQQKNHTNSSQSFQDSPRDSISLSSLGRERSRSNSFTFRHGHSHGDSIKNPEIATVAWMIIFGDGLHNFIDGLSIGAAFSESILSGISISVACICEEFPHELGDFAVLIASGMTLRQALGYNFLSACTCYLGMAFGILLGDLSESSSYIFALAAGMFLYIALVDMMGELSAALDEASQQSMSQVVKVLLLQHIGILVGVSSLLFLAKYSEKINFEGLAPPVQSDMPFTAN